jgi:hypothetical protein
VEATALLPQQLGIAKRSAETEAIKRNGSSIAGATASQQQRHSSSNGRARERLKGQASAWVDPVQKYLLLLVQKRKY